MKIRAPANDRRRFPRDLKREANRATMPQNSMNALGPRSGAFQRLVIAKDMQPLTRGRKDEMEKIPMTRAGFDLLDEELRELRAVDRPAVIRAIAEAREHGDLSENAEYHAAREKQSFVEGRIKELEGIISRAEVIDPSKFSGSVKFGATVTLVDEDTEEERTYQIVGEAEADLERGLLNMRSPLARALIGKDEGDSVEVVTPGGGKSYEIISIRFI